MPPERLQHEARAHGLSPHEVARALRALERADLASETSEGWVPRRLIHHGGAPGGPTPPHVRLHEAP